MPEFNPRISRGEEYGGAKAEFMAKTPGRGKSALTGALQGFLRGGGLAGAATGAIYGAADPRGLREQEFNRTRRPQLLERFALEDQDRAAARQAEQDALNNQYKQAQIGEIGSQNAYRASQAEIGRENATRQVEVARSTIDLNNARAEAARLGTPVYKDLVDDTDGKVKTFQVFPDGRKILAGGSAQAAYNAANIKSREGIAARREAGTNARAERREAGVNARSGQRQTRVAPGSKGEASKEAIEEAFRRAGGHKAGWTLKGMKKHFKDKGYTVPE